MTDERFDSAEDAEDLQQTAPITGLPVARSEGGSWTPPAALGAYGNQVDSPPGPTVPRPKPTPAFDDPPTLPYAEQPAPVELAAPFGPPPPSAPAPDPQHMGAGGWAQPATGSNPIHPTWRGYPPPQPQPLQLGRRPVQQPKGRVPLWLLPTVAALALILGVAGGALGAFAYDRWSNDGTFAGGLNDTGTRTEAPLPAENGSIAAVAEAVLPSTVQIIADYKGESGGASGSGFVLDSQGHVITNNHVVADAAKSNGSVEIVDQEGNRFKATVLGRSAVYDLAVLQVPEAKDLPPAALGSSTAMNIGDPVVAIGSPLGLSSTVTSGIVSARDRPVTTGDSSDDTSYINAVQTDAAINPGNSGGPLVDLSGKVIGVNSAIATTGGGLGGESGNIGVGFAIPIEQVKVTADQILRTGEAKYPVIGAGVATGGSSTGGAEISEVLPNSPAEAAGLENGDLVTALDGVRITDGIALIVKIRTHQPGEKITLSVSRDGADKQVEIQLAGEVG